MLDCKIKMQNPIILKRSILLFIKTEENSVFALHDIVSIKLFTRLRLSFSHLIDHKFRRNFKDTINLVCLSRKDI